MGKTFTLLLSLFVLYALTACGGGKKAAPLTVAAVEEPTSGFDDDQTQTIVDNATFTCEIQELPAQVPLAVQSFKVQAFRSGEAAPSKLVALATYAGNSLAGETLTLSTSEYLATPVGEIQFKQEGPLRVVAEVSDKVTPSKIARCSANTMGVQPSVVLKGPASALAFGAPLALTWDGAGLTSCQLRLDEVPVTLLSPNAYLVQAVSGTDAGTYEVECTTLSSGTVKSSKVVAVGAAPVSSFSIKGSVSTKAIGHASSFYVGDITTQSTFELSWNSSPGVGCQLLKGSTILVSSPTGTRTESVPAAQVQYSLACKNAFGVSTLTRSITLVPNSPAPLKAELATATSSVSYGARPDITYSCSNAAAIKTLSLTLNGAKTELALTGSPMKLPSLKEGQNIITLTCKVGSLEVPKSITIVSQAPRNHLAFVTLKVFQGNIGSVAAADAICQAQAKDYHLREERPWKAILSAKHIRAHQRIYLSGDIHTPTSLYAETWQKVSASDKFWTGNWEAPLNRFESGAQVTSGYVWTGFKFGDLNNNVADCNEWKANGSANGILGKIGATNGQRFNFDAGPAKNCFNQHRIYCISQ